MKPILFFCAYIFDAEFVKGFCFVHERTCVILRTHMLRYAFIIAVIQFACFISFFAIGPLHNPVTMLRNKLCWDANNTVGLSKQGTGTSPARRFFVLKVPLCYLRPSIIFSVPCDRIMQRENQRPCNGYRRS